MEEETDIRPFKVEIDQDEVFRLQRKLRETRIPGREIVPGAGDKYGPTLDWATDLYHAWTTRFDWYEQQNSINQHPQFTTPIEDINIHFVHQRSASPSACPILLIHGWPGSFYEFSQVITPLSNPPSDSTISFHVVVPSLPGFCWSDSPPRPGWTMQDNARIFDQLMKKLGYLEYAVQAGDWGTWTARELGAKYTESCKMVHLNFAPSPLPEEGETTERERKVQGRVEDWLNNHLGYAVVMRSRPHTIGWALTDNPIGIMMWIGEKYNEVANPANQSHPAWTTHILTTVSLYYFTNCIMTSMLPYYENIRHEQFPAFAVLPENRITVPLGFTSFFWDTRPSSKNAVGRTGNLVWYRERDEAGHFAALECPEGLIEDLRDFVATVLKRG